MTNRSEMVTVFTFMTRPTYSQESLGLSGLWTGFTRVSRPAERGPIHEGAFTIAQLTNQCFPGKWFPVPTSPCQAIPSHSSYRAHHHYPIASSLCNSRKTVVIRQMRTGPTTTAIGEPFHHQYLFHSTYMCNA